jgi:hypothetical protein
MADGGRPLMMFKRSNGIEVAWAIQHLTGNSLVQLP